MAWLMQPLSCGDGWLAGAAVTFGLGRVKKRIRRAFVGCPGRIYRTTELALWAYPKLGRSCRLFAGRRHRTQNSPRCRAEGSLRGQKWTWPQAVVHICL